MLRSLPLLLFALAAGACGDASPSVDLAEPAAAVGAEVSTTEASAEPSDPVETMSASADGAPAPDATPTATPAATPAATSGTPMVEIGFHASVSHATSRAETLTLRGGPSTSAANVGTFGEGLVLECQDRKRDDAWCRIRADMPDGSEPIGWAKRRHLVYTGMLMVEKDGVRVFGNEDAWGPASGGLSVNAVNDRWDILADDGYANVRATPSADGALVRRLDNRTMTTVERCTDADAGRRWCRISAPVAGWVHQSGFHRELRSL